MKERGFNAGPLIWLQQVTWYAVLVYFGGIIVISLLDFPKAFDLAAYGIIFVLVATTAKLVVMAEEFRKTGLRRFQGLSYMLIFILAAIVAGKYLF
jgi:TRAP-type mannitol/chloroaromatic compound transport system permease large subunit